MNEHVTEILDVVDAPVDPVFSGVVQDDSDYHVDPLDDFPETNAFGSAAALDEAERLDEVKVDLDNDF